MRLLSVILISSCLTLLCFTGCSKNVPLKGRVTFSDDGTPLEKGIVCLENEQGIARGALGKNGFFTVGSQRHNDGLPAGTYRVYITGAQQPLNDGTPFTVSLIDRKFTRPETSGLEFFVNQSNHRLIFQVDRAPLKKSVRNKTGKPK